MNIPVKCYIDRAVNEKFGKRFGIDSELDAGCRKSVTQGMKVYSRQTDFLSRLLNLY